MGRQGDTEDGENSFIVLFSEFQTLLSARMSLIISSDGGMREDGVVPFQCCQAWPVRKEPTRTVFSEYFLNFLLAAVIERHKEGNVFIY